MDFTTVKHHFLSAFNFRKFREKISKLKYLQIVTVFEYAIVPHYCI